MNKNEFLEQITAIGTCEDDSQRRTMLASLQSGVEAVFDENTSLNEGITERDTQIADLQKNNMDLFLQVSAKSKPEDKPSEDSGQKLTYENLFNDKGELK